MKLRALKRIDLEKLREWRNEDSSYLRTPFFLTEKMQEDWYNKVVSDRSSKFRFYGITESDKLIGYGGFEIQWENRLGELALVIGKPSQQLGYGTKAVKLLINVAFDELNLETIQVECYQNNPHKSFWMKIGELYKAHKTIIPRRKFRNGEYHSSDFYTITK